jgi:hypothetical protein
VPRLGDVVGKLSFAFCAAFIPERLMADSDDRKGTRSASILDAGGDRV